MVELQKNEKELVDSVMGKINLSKDKENLESHVVNLSKCVIDLSKKNNVDLGATKARVVVVLDYSGSMRRLYDNGEVQKALHKLIPLGLTFDDNGSIDVYLFQDTYKKLSDMTLENYDNYIKGVVNKSGYSMGGTMYAPVLKAIAYGNNTDKKKGLFGKLFGGKSKESDSESMVGNTQPTFVLFITDGDNFDVPETTELMKQISKENMFIQFIGIGGASFSFLEQLDNLEGREVDNTGFSRMDSLVTASDNELYNNVLSQFAEWLRVTQG